MSGPASPASCYLVQADADGRTWSVVLDLGSGAFGPLMNHADAKLLDAVVLSHLHADHMSDMIGYHVFRRWHPDGQLGPIDVLAPAGAAERVRGVGGDGPGEDFSADFTFHVHQPGTAWSVGPLRIESTPVDHPVEAYAVRITGPSENGSGPAVLTYSGDTDACENLVSAARDAQLFLCEAAFVEGRDTVRGLHLTGRRAGRVATQAGVRQLVLTHIQPWTDPATVAAEAAATFDGPIAVAAAGQTWTL